MQRKTYSMKFVGNKKVVDMLARAIRNGRIGHAYIFSGPEHVGKFTLAKMFALHAISGSELDLDIDNFDKEALFDLLVVKPEIVEKNKVFKQRDISIESIREAKKSLSLFPYSGKRKVLIVDDAHRMNISAQNALLKIFEEPNPTTMIILVTSEVDRILPTIQSRSQMLNLGLVSDEDMSNAFGQGNVDISIGRPGLEFQDESEKEFRADSISDLAKIYSVSLNDRFKMAEEFSKDVPRTLQRLDIWTWEMRKKGIFVEGNERMRIYENIEKIQKSIQLLKRTNASSRLILETLFMDM